MDASHLSWMIAVYVDTAIIILTIGYLCLNIDDVVLDVFFYARGIHQKMRRLGRKYSAGNNQEIYDRAFEKIAEARIAVFIPCWHEAEVVEHMLSLAMKRIAYKRYEIFVGVYPNDPETQAKVDAVCAGA